MGLITDTHLQRQVIIKILVHPDMDVSPDINERDVSCIRDTRD